MRQSGEEYILELFREVFFENKEEDSKNRPMDPEAELEGENVFTKNEKYSIYMGRGRKKVTKTQDRHTDYYLPLYPSLARRSWRRKNDERVLKDFFMPAIYQHQADRDQNEQSKKKDFGIIIRALAGSNTPDNDRLEDIAGLGFDHLEGCLSEDDAIQRLFALCDECSKSQYKLGEPDDLSAQIYKDFVNLCHLQMGKTTDIDRLQWMSLLMTFLRLASSVLLLARMKPIIVLRDKLINVLSGENNDVDEVWVKNLIQTRIHGLIQPNLTGTSQINEYVDEYTRASIELTTLIYLIEKHEGADWNKLELFNSVEKDIDIVRLVGYGKGLSDKLNQSGGLSFRQALTRKVENWAALKGRRGRKATGYIEHLNGLRKIAKGDEDGGYLTYGGAKVYKIFPGNLMIKLITYLAVKKNETDGRKAADLSDVEKHFKIYGVDFSENGELRKKLIKSFLDMGLLKGSPDAGDSAGINSPWKI